MSNTKCQQTTMNLQWAKPDVKRQQQAFNGQNRVTKTKKQQAFKGQHKVPADCNGQDGVSKISSRCL